MIVSRPSTRSRILERGLDLMSVVGLTGISLGPLAEDVGMSKSGLFAHFQSKDAVQIALLAHAAEIADKQVVSPSMAAPPGLPRLKALFRHWLGWSTKAGLSGGCPVAAGLFELDDVEGNVRDAVARMEDHWRNLLLGTTQEAVDLGHLASDLDVEQFVWELCALYLGHHASVRFLKDTKADSRVAVAFEALLARAGAMKRSVHPSSRGPLHGKRRDVGT